METAPASESFQLKNAGKAELLLSPFRASLSQAEQEREGPSPTSHLLSQIHIPGKGQFAALPPTSAHWSSNNIQR